MLFNVLSPFTVSIDASTFSDAAKRFVKMQRNLDITRLILADRTKNTMRADIAYTLRDGNVVAGISLRPTIYPNMPYNVGPYGISPYGVSPYGISPYGVSPYGVSPGLGLPVQPAGLVKTTSDGQQVFPINNDNIAVGGVNVNMGLGFAPTMAHGFPYGTLNKNLKN